MDQERPDVADAEEDTEGQALTWKVRKPIPEAQEDDAEGQGMRPPPDVTNPAMPNIDEDDEVEGHGGMTGTPHPPVD